MSHVEIKKIMFYFQSGLLIHFIVIVLPEQILLGDNFFLTKSVGIFY